MSVRVGDSSRRSEKIVKSLDLRLSNRLLLVGVVAYYYYYYYNYVGVVGGRKKVLVGGMACGSTMIIM